MEHRTFDDLARWLAARATRRATLGLMTALGVGVVLPEAGDGKSNHEHRKSRKKRKKRFCLNGKNIKAKNKRRKRRLRRRGAVRGRCKACTPICPTDSTCGMDDGCGSPCGCAGDNVCVAGACTSCTVTCGDDATTCGATLQTALTAGGTVYVCPGLYSTPTGFIALANTSIHGAGSGGDQATNTILTLGGATGTVLALATLAPATISGLRVTGGNVLLGAGGLMSTGSGVLTMDDCAVVDNTGSVGGLQVLGLLKLMNSLVTGNTGLSGPGGLRHDPVVTGGTSEITNTIFDDNHGVNMGGIEISSSVTADVQVDSASQITNNTYAAIVGARAGGIGTTAGNLATVTVSGTTISGNTLPQCLNVTGCSS